MALETDRVVRDIIAQRNRHEKHMAKLRQKAERLADIARANCLFVMGTANQAPWAERQKVERVEQEFLKTSDQAEALLQLLGGRQ